MELRDKERKEGRGKEGRVDRQDQKKVEGVERQGQEKTGARVIATTVKIKKEKGRRELSDKGRGVELQGQRKRGWGGGGS